MEQNTVTIQEAARLLLGWDDILILTHKSPDGDTLGSGFALYYGLVSLGKRVSLACSDEIPEKYHYFTQPVPPLPRDPERVVAVDIADPQLFGERLESFASRVDLCIDHHRSNSCYAKKTWLDPEASAVCEMMLDLLRQMGASVTSRIADCLYTGIATDTGCFKFSNTTDKTHQAAAELIRAGADYVEINRLMFDTKSKNRVVMEQKVLSGMEFYFEDQCAVISVPWELFVSSGAKESDLDGVSALSRQIEGVEVGVMLREKEDGSIKVSIRTTREADASAICKAFGGGGHLRAAGCVLEGPISQARDKLLPVIKKALQEL